MVERLAARVFALCGVFDVLPLTGAAAELSAAVRARLETSGQRIGPHDVLIAGIALANNRVLVTHNSREFGRVLDLKIEDWFAPLQATRNESYN